jgi:hypothetical protein
MIVAQADIPWLENIHDQSIVKFNILQQTCDLTFPLNWMRIRSEEVKVNRRAFT